MLIILPLYTALREESSQTNVILLYKLLASILSAVCRVIQQSWYVLHFYYTSYDGKYDCNITKYNCNITKYVLSVYSVDIKINDKLMISQFGCIL